jgi:polyisoprenyl-phosphate glycosyltransferase
MSSLSKLPLMTIVIPVFNEQECITESFNRLKALRDKMKALCEIELLFVDDGSSDLSLKMLSLIALENSFVKLISFSRNFGHQIAVSAGIDHTQGDFVALIDADLQDPPEVIVEMFEILVNGYDVVYGVRKERKGESFLKKITASAFYRLLSYLCDIDIPKDTGDFRLMSKKVVDELKLMREKHRFIRGMIPWLGFNSIGYEYDRDERYAGKTKYHLRKMLGLAVNAVLSFSWKPLALAMKFGFIVTFVGIVGIFYMLYVKLFTDVALGVTAIIITIIVFGGFQIILTSLIGGYVARIFDEVKGRPMYVIEKRYNL